MLHFRAGLRLMKLVRRRGLEPPRAEAHQPLKLARLPNSATAARDESRGPVSGLQTKLRRTKTGLPVSGSATQPYPKPLRSPGFQLGGGSPA